MKKTQRSLRFSLPRNPDEPEYLFQARQRLFNNPPEVAAVHPSELFARILKRQAKSVLNSITRCQSHAIAANLDNLRCLCELIDFAVQHEWVSEHERYLSGMQLAYPKRVMDFRACLDHAKEYHRSPVSFDRSDEIIARLDLLAGLVLRSNCAHSSATGAGDPNTNGGAQ